MEVAFVVKTCFFEENKNTVQGLCEGFQIPGSKIENTCETLRGKRFRVHEDWTYRIMNISLESGEESHRST